MMMMMSENRGYAWKPRLRLRDLRKDHMENRRKAQYITGQPQETLGKRASLRKFCACSFERRTKSLISITTDATEIETLQISQTLNSPLITARKLHA